MQRHSTVLSSRVHPPPSPSSSSRVPRAKVIRREGGRARSANLVELDGALHAISLQFPFLRFSNGRARARARSLGRLKVERACARDHTRARRLQQRVRRNAAAPLNSLECFGNSVTARAVARHRFVSDGALLDARDRDRERDIDREMEKGRRGGKHVEHVPRRV